MRDRSYTIRQTSDASDLDAIIEAHRRFYGELWGVGEKFAVYVRTALAEIIERKDAGDSAVWVAEIEGCFAGSIGVAARPSQDAQIRVLLVEPRRQGRGIGRALLSTALAFCRERRFSHVYLWTVQGLDAAASLYRDAGFTRTEKITRLVWGKMLTEEKWEKSVKTSAS